MIISSSWQESYGKPRQCVKKKKKDNILQTKVHIVKAVVSPVVMCSCESYIIKIAEHQIIDAFEL